MRNKIILWLTALVLLASCSATKNIPDDDKLFVGLTKIDYQHAEKSAHFDATKEEVEAALATPPNGALFGSSYHRTPFPVGLWIWDAFSGKESKFAKWMTKSFGRPPVLMSWVNPELRANVAQSVLRNNGYFHGKVGYEIVPQKNPKTSKIGYHVDMGHLYTLDSIQYVNFPTIPDSLIRLTSDEAYIHKGDPFTVSALDAERNRLTTLFRNNGYYYYQSGYASYLADTVAVPGKAQLRLQLAEDLPANVMKKWYIGKIKINMRKTFMERLNDSIQRRFLTIRYNGKRPPIRPRVLLGSMRLRPRKEYRYSDYQETLNKLNATGLYSSTDFKFTPRDSSANCDTLDLVLNCTFERPYDFYIETNFTHRTIGRMGPELKMGITRRNAFRGGEKLDINIQGSYEWQTKTRGGGMNNYEVGIDASVEFPRIIAPFFGGNRPRKDKNGHYRRRFFSTPSTIAKLAFNIIQRPGYYRMHMASGEWTYRWRTSEQSQHEFSPFTMKYQFKNRYTEAFTELMETNPYLKATMADYFVPEMRYTYTYTSPKNYRNPIRWETTIAEASNLISLGYVIGGKKWNQKNKKLLNNPYSQFLKIETDFTKTWSLGTDSKLVGHVNLGVIAAYGNSDKGPFSELFYVGGANSIRAFPVRGIGPGKFVPIDGGSAGKSSYLMQNGDFKFVANLEYRKKLFGNFHGAVFLDVGNVWNLKDYKGDDAYAALYEGTKFKVKNFFKELAVGTGIGLRYDLDFLVIRVDWGIALHVPYETGKSGFFNMGRFKDSQTLHIAIGYPF